MRLSIVIIGDEILLGQVTDTNSGYIARSLVPHGWEVVRTLTIGDNRSQIKQAVEDTLAASDLVITTGGLGPTKDDITKGVLCECFGGELVYDQSVAANVEQIFAKRNLQLNELTRQQAWVPSCCRVIQNELGTAPIMWFERDGKVLISMPGVPFETEGMLQRKVISEIGQHFCPDKEYLHHTVIASGLPESALAQRLDEFERSLPANMHLAYLPNPGYIRLRLDGTFPAGQPNAALMDSYLQRLKSELGPLMIYDGDATPAMILLDRLQKRGLTVSSAESCTGGNIAHSITSIAGSSACYMGSVVSYSNDVKANVLGVSREDLDAYGAVSEPVVIQMAQGVRRITATDCSMSTSGIAGPGGATPGKPVGTVWIAASCGDATVTRLVHLPGNRQRVIDRATTEAILLLLSLL